MMTFPFPKPNQETIKPYYFNANSFNRSEQIEDKDAQKIVERLKSLGCKFELTYREKEKEEQTVSFNIKYQTKKYYLGLPIPKWLAKIIGEQNLFTEYGECEVENEG